MQRQCRAHPDELVLGTTLDVHAAEQPTEPRGPQDPRVDAGGDGVRAGEGSTEVHRDTVGQIGQAALASSTGPASCARNCPVTTSWRAKTPSQPVNCPIRPGTPAAPAH